MVFGYARVSTFEQNLDLQIDALLKEGVEQKNIYVDKVSGSSDQRVELDKLFNHLREDDTLLVWKLDRMARSLIHFTDLANQLKEKGVAFKSITEPFLDTTSASPHGKFLINIFALLAEFERDIIIERTKAGLESARRRGKILGPPRGLSKKAEQKAVLVEEYFKNGQLTVEEILVKLDISRGTYYKYLRYRGVDKIRGYKKNEGKKN